MTRWFTSMTVAMALACFPLAHADGTPDYLSHHETTPQDQAAIRQLLANYTGAVNSGNQAAFEALLLSDQVPFSSTSELSLSHAEARQVITYNYAGFRKIVFQSGLHFAQKFYNVHIEQDGPLAQVSLDFVTADAATGSGGYGFKTLQLLKVNGSWKIASEFYTAHSLPKKS